MKPCPWCRRELPNWASACTYPDCGRALEGEASVAGKIPPPPPPPSSPHAPPAHGLAQTIASPPPPPPATPAPPPPPRTPSAPEVSCAPPPAWSERGPPEVAGTGPAVDLDLKLQLEGIERRVRVRRRQGSALGGGALAAVVLAAACWAAYHLAAVYQYAALDPDALEVRRDDADPDRLVLEYLPLGGGRVGFSREAGEPHTEILDRVTPAQLGTRQRFDWRVSGIQTGDALHVSYRRGLSLDRVELRVPPPSPAPALGDAVIEGIVLNAVDREPIAGAEVRVVGTRLAARTDQIGRFEIRDAPCGPVPIEVSMPGFSTGQLERDLKAHERCRLRVALGPGMEAGRIRIELVWEDAALDLDAHLRGPLPDGGQFHVYYHQMGDLRCREYVRLDADAAQDGGPETVTILGVLPGTYHYFVHDYTHREDPKSAALARSGAEVVVYQGGQTHRFRVRHEQPGNLWNVCAIDVTPAGAVVRKLDTIEAAKAEALGLYAKRTRPDRGEWIGRYGGSQRSEEAVAGGLAWLARHQAEDGSWGNYSLGDGDPRSRCEKDGPPCALPGEKYEMAQTGLALLAFQAGGHYYFNGSKYSGAVRKGLDWLVARQKADGALVSDRPQDIGSTYYKNYMYDHGIAAFALAEACAVAADAREPQNAAYLEALRRAVRYIESQQHQDGGWRYSFDDLKSPGDTSVSGWQVLALKSAREAGVAPGDACLAKIRSFFRHMETGEHGRTWYRRMPRPTPPEIQTEATTAIGMLVHQFMLDQPDSELVREAADYLAGFAEEQWTTYDLNERDKDFYLWYNGTLAMYQAGGRNWARWNAVVRDILLRLQRIDGCERGSWDPTSRWGQYGGRVYSTALAVLTLEVYYRYAAHEETLDWLEPTHDLPADRRPKQ